MGSRIDAVREMGEPGSRKMWALEEACTLAKDLFHWDEKTGLPYLRRMVQTCRDYLGGNDAGSPRTAAMGELGARSPNSRRCASRRATARPWTSTPVGSLAFGPIRIISTNCYGRCGKILIGRPWRRRPSRCSATPIQSGPGNWCVGYHVRRTWRGRRWECRHSGEPPVGGTEQRREDRHWSRSTRAEEPRPQWMAAIPAGRASAPKATCQSRRWPGRTPFRVCDDCAWVLVRFDGRSSCQPYWPRERARQGCGGVCGGAAAVRRAFSLFWRPSGALWAWSDNPQARMTFPPLDHPATAEDVKKGLAIFTLESEGKDGLGKADA